MKKDNNDLQKVCVFGHNGDNAEKLEKLSKQRAEKVIELIDMSNQKEVSVPFWTDDFPSELICVCKISLDEKGTLKNDLDFSQSTI
ncbi:MAG: hypothetical protein VZQ58_01805 [Bacteroidales bacterium]|nr:hypothetical protein [Bacteroidales bacterium]